MLTLINILPDEWTPIAARRRCRSEWTVLPNAPCNLKQAQEMCSNGLLLQALRYDDKVVEVVVRHRGRHRAEKAVAGTYSKRTAESVEAPGG